MKCTGPCHPCLSQYFLPTPSTIHVIQRRWMGTERFNLLSHSLDETALLNTFLSPNSTHGLLNNIPHLPNLALKLSLSLRNSSPGPRIEIPKTTPSRQTLPSLFADAFLKPITFRTVQGFSRFPGHREPILSGRYRLKTCTQRPCSRN